GAAPPPPRAGSRSLPEAYSLSHSALSDVRHPEVRPVARRARAGPPPERQERRRARGTSATPLRDLPQLYRSPLSQGRAAGRYDASDQPADREGTRRRRQRPTATATRTPRSRATSPLREEGVASAKRFRPDLVSCATPSSRTRRPSQGRRIASEYRESHRRRERDPGRS